MKTIKIFGSKLSDQEVQNKKFASPLLDKIKGDIDSYSLETPHRSEGKISDQMMDVDGMVYYEFEDGTFLYLTPQEVTQLCQNERSTRNFRSPNLKDNELFISASFAMDTTRDNWVQKGLAKIVSFITGTLMDDIIEETGERAVFKIAQKLEVKAVVKPGIYSIDKDRLLHENPVLVEDQHYFLFVHGTNSNTINAFLDPGQDVNKSETNGKFFSQIIQQYSDKIIALEHHTLTKTPLENVLDLVNGLPKKVDLTILSHSRGGLVTDALLLCVDAKKDNTRSAKVADFLKDENRNLDLSVFSQIMTALDQREINIRQVIKVASPGAGTTLLSDNVINLIRVMFEFGKQFTSILGDQIQELTEKLLVAMIKSKDKQELLAGLESMTPENPFLEMINSYEYLMDEPKCYLMAGKSRLSFNIGHALKFILSRLVIRDDSDMVINTSSMTQGLRFKSGLNSLATNGTVHHSSYFYQKNTATEISKAITTQGDFQPASTLRTITDLSQRGIELEYGNYRHQSVSGTRPVTVVIPGMMASTLTNKNDNRIWIDYLDIFSRSLLDMGINETIKVDGILASAYESFCKFLIKAGHDVYVIPYDWRLSHSSQLPILQSHLKTILANAGNQQPIRIVTHSKGGLLFRQLALDDFALYSELASRASFRWIMLGTPWYGSYAAVKTLIGQSKTLKNLKRISFLVSYKQLLTIFSQYAGILEMLPLNLSNEKIVNNAQIYDYTANQTWNDIFNQDIYENYKWVIPDVAQYKISDLRERVGSIQFGKVDDNTNGQLTLKNENIYYVAGMHETTPYLLDIDTTQHELRILDLPYQGDGTVTWVEGIPIGFDKTKLFYTDTKHDRLMDNDRIFSSILQLIERGKCNLSQEAPMRTTRSGGKEQNALEPVYTSRLTATQSKAANIRAIFDDDTYTSSQQWNDEVLLNVKLSHGDLMFSDGPLMIGHFENETITKAEATLDSLLEGHLTTQFYSGSYPDMVGESLYIYKSKHHKPKGALVIGLGETIRLSAFALTESIRKAVISAILQHKTEDNNAKLETLSTLLIGTAYGDLTVPSSINAIIDGVYEANQYITRMNQNEQGHFETIKTLEFIEIYQDKANFSFYELKRLAYSSRINFYPPSIGTKPGSRSALSTNYGIDKWNNLRIRLNGGCPIFDNNQTNCVLSCHSCHDTCSDDCKAKSAQQGIKITNCKNSQKYLEFDLGTGIARDENRKNFISLDNAKAYMDQIKRETDREKLWDKQISKVLFEMLIPQDFKQEIRSQYNLVLNLDVEAASFPWELIQDTAIAQKPICVNAGMIRRLNTPNFRNKPRYSKEKNVLIIGDPILNAPNLSQLSGAEAEARQVVESFAGKMNVIERISCLSGDILQGIYANESRAIHVAAHGDFDPLDPRKSGIIIGYNELTKSYIYLNSSNIEQMDVIPDFVFINTCYSGKITEQANDFSYSTYGFAANVGIQFMAVGVKAVIVAGWPVYDDLAQTFATEFYKHFLEEIPFGESVQRAREACYDADPNRNTWGAYQCYGDPSYTFRITSSNKLKEYSIGMEIQNDLQKINNKLDYFKGHESEITEELLLIDDAIIRLDISDGTILEKRAEVYAKCADISKSINLYTNLLTLDKALYSLKAVEQLQNLKAKKAVENFLASTADRNPDGSVPAIIELDMIINNLLAINAIGESSERNSLLGSSYKRKAYIECKINDKNYVVSLKHSLDAYRKALDLKNGDQSYAKLNVIILDYLLNGSSSVLIKDCNNINHLDDISGDYYKDIVNFNKELTAYLLDKGISSKSKIENTIKQLKVSFDKIWKYSGSNNKLKGEIEQLEMIYTFISQSPQPNASKMEVVSKIIEYLKKI